MEAIASLFVAMILALPVTIVVSATGQQEALCKQLGGKYEPKPAPGEVCPGGKWSNIARAAPTK
jgi:hypothetical protein